MVASYLLSFCEWVRDAGLPGVVAYEVFLAVNVAFGMPIIGVLEFVPGFLFGFWQGVAMSIVGKCLGNALALAVVSLARDRVHRVMNRFTQFRVIEKLVLRGGFPSVLVVRLIYMPMVVKNYGLGLLDVPRWQILLAGFLTAAPFACLWTYCGTKAKTLVDVLQGNAKPSGLEAPPVAVLALGLIFVGFAVFVLRWVKTQWKTAADEVELEKAKTQ